MTMKKILMAAVAVSALTAGVANAATIIEAKVANKALTVADATANPAVAAKSYALANSVVVATEANVTTVGDGTDGKNLVKAKLSSTTGVFAPNTNGTTYSATYTLSGSGNPVFAVPITSAVLSTAATSAGTIASPTCLPTTPQAVSGGAIGSNSVTFAFTVNPGTGTSAACNTTNAPTTIAFDAPFKLTAAGSATVSIDFKIAQTGAAFDGAAATQPLVTTADPYVVKVEADTLKLTTLALSSGSAGYVSLKTDSDTQDGVLGKVTAKIADTPATADWFLAKLDGTTVIPPITADVSVSATAGNFSIITPKIGTSTSGTVSTANSSLFTDAPTSGLDLSTAKNVAVTIAAANTTQISSAQTYTATITPKLAAYTVLQKPAAVGPTALQTINLEGTSFLAPWISGSQSGNISNIRISNNSSLDTGAITLTLKSPGYLANTAPAVAPGQCTAAKLTSLTKIAANSDLQIFTEDLKTCFGDFKRADILITIQAASANLTAKARINKGGVDSEISLGTLDKSNVSF